MVAMASRMPREVPAAIPPISPVQVLPSPRMRLPFQVRPKSTGVPPPNSTAAEFGINAGRNRKMPLSATRIRSIGGRKEHPIDYLYRPAARKPAEEGRTSR